MARAKARGAFMLTALLLACFVGLGRTQDNVAILSSRTLIDDANGSPRPFQSLALKGCEEAMEGFHGAGAASRARCRFQVVATTAASVRAVAQDPDFFHIVAIGFEFESALLEVLPDFPTRSFALVDSALSGLDNGQGLLFAEHELGFMAGAMAGMVTRSKVVGVVAGLPFPALVRFSLGYLRGTKYTCPDCTVLQNYELGFDDVAAGIATATRFIEQGSDVLFGAAGALGRGTILWAAGEGQWVIGVDEDESKSTFRNTTPPALAGQLLGSAEKRVDVAVRISVDEKLREEWSGGSKVADLSVDGVVISECAHATACSELARSVLYREDRAEGCPEIVRSTIGDRVNDIRLNMKSGGLSTGVSFDGHLLPSVNPRNNSWGVLESFGPVPGGGADGTLVYAENNTFLHFGGRGASSAAGALHAFNYDYNTWTLLAPSAPDLARTRHTALLWGTQMVVYGGTTGGLTALNDVRSWDVRARRWSLVATAGSSQPAGRFGHVAALSGDRMLVFGGTVGGAASPQLWALHLGTRTWARLADAPAARTEAAAAVWGDYLYVFGGTDGIATSADMLRYHIGAGTWAVVRLESDEEGEAPPPALRSHAMLSDEASGRLLVLGGQLADGTASARVFAFDAAGEERVHFYGYDALPSAVHSAAAASFVQADYSLACVFTPPGWMSWPSLCSPQSRRALLVFGGVDEAEQSAGQFSSALRLLFVGAEVDRPADLGASVVVNEDGADVALIVPLVLVGALLVFGGAFYYYYRAQGRKVEGLKTWKLDPSDLQVHTVLGEGAFGVVYKGTFRGTEVAIKTWKTASGQSALDTGVLSARTAGGGSKIAQQIKAIENKAPKKVGWRETATAAVSMDAAAGSGNEATKRPGSTSNTLLSSADKTTRKLDAETMNGFMREIDVMISLRHPNVIQFMGAVVEKESLAMVIELMETNLFDYMNVVKRTVKDNYSLERELAIFPFEQRKSIMNDTARGMEYLHSARPPLLHLDMKSPNLLLDEHFKCKVADFGLAIVHSKIQAPKENDDGEIKIQGSLLWMSPEVLLEQHFSTACDVYAYGVIMWEISSLKIPYQGIPQDQVVNTIAGGTPPVPHSFPHLPVEWTNMMKAAWTFDHKKRPPFSEISQWFKSMPTTVNFEAAAAATHDRENQVEPL